MTTMTIADARAHLGDVLGRVRHAGERITLTARGCPAVAIVPIADLEALEAAEDAADAAAAAQALADYRSGKDPGIPLAVVKAEFAKRRRKG